MDRICEILYLLLEREMPITIDEIANKLFVSNRTIRNDLAQVGKVLRDNGLLLSKKPGIGVAVEGPEEKKLKLISDIKLISNRHAPFSPEDRKNFILMKLFLDKADTKIKDLIKELYVSRSTLKKDLDSVNNWLENFDLKLVKKSNSSIGVMGSEKNCRNAIASLVAANKEKNEPSEVIFEGKTKRIDYDTVRKLKVIIDIDYLRLEDITINAEKVFGFEFSYEAFINFVIHIAIAIKRIREGKSIKLSEAVMCKLKDKEEYHIAKQIADDIYESFEIELPEQEIGYILLHILGTNLQQDTMNVDLKGEEDYELAQKMAVEIIQIAQRALMMDFTSDEQLLNGLTLHLRPTINRLEYDLDIRNPILGQIKESFPEIYGVAWMTNTVFQQYLGKKINDDEVGYISMHLAAAVERKKDLIKTLVVCTSGIGSSQLLAAKLQKHFAQLDIRDVTSVVAINDSKLKDIDIIISTVPIISEKPVLTISPLLTQNDIEITLNFIKNLNKKDCSQLFTEDFIEVNASYSKREDVLKTAAGRLEEKGFGREGFGSSVFAREEIGRTEIGKGVVVSHGFPEYVNLSQISVTILKKPIKWVYNKVDIIFVIALSKEDIKKSPYPLKKFYRALDSDNFLNMLRKANSKEEVKEIIKNVFR